MIDKGFGPNSAVVTMDDTGDSRQTDTGTSKILVSVKAVEGIKEFISVKHIETGAIIANEPGSLFLIPSELDHGIQLLGAEFHRVSE